MCVETGFCLVRSPLANGNYHTILCCMHASSYSEIYTYNILYCLILTGTLLVAPMDLTVEIISYQMLVVSWNYPSSLLAQTMFKVTNG